MQRQGARQIQKREGDKSSLALCSLLFGVGGGFRMSIRVRLSGLLFTVLFILPIRFTGLSGQTGTEPNR